MPSEALLRQYDRPGPRYTSYPTADRFGPLAPADLDDAFAGRRARSTAGPATAAAAIGHAAGPDFTAESGFAAEPPLSLYVHLPFCASICYYCGCNRIATRDPRRAARYLTYLIREIERTADRLGAARRVADLHLGGGTPTFHDDDALAALLAALRMSFAFDDDAELSIEIDPRTVDAARIARLRALGFDRISFGVQDFDPAVQQAIHRIQPVAAVEACIAAARTSGFASINADLIYGLPRQTPESFGRTLDETIRLRPDRIALYGYAHLPARFKPQRRIDPRELPDGAGRVALLAQALERFVAAGYEPIGMDHFALTGDPLAIARRTGRLRRDFQGYTTTPGGDLLGFGVSAISRIGDLYVQNLKTLDAYYARLDAGAAPVERGVRLTADDCLRRDAIAALMCQGRVDLDRLAGAYGRECGEAFGPELAGLAPLAAAGLVRVSGALVDVTDTGWFLVRNVAMQFDRYLGRPADPAAPPIRRAIPILPIPDHQHPTGARLP
ncbi:MAG: oxygen-independent coproporphyrinogen III oxidase [Lautropia sp.]